MLLVSTKLVRIQKLLASHGHGSRRYIEKLILAGQVTCNGKVAQLGDTAGYRDKISLNNKPIALVRSKNIPRILIYNKPAGEICSNGDPKGRNTVYDKLPAIDTGRWIGIGRLDYTTTGLYMFTNDGELANLFIQPKQALPRTYLVKVNKPLDKQLLDKFLQGVMIEGEKFVLDKLQLHRGLGKSCWYTAVVSRGRNHEVKKIFAAGNVLVSRLKRISFGDISLPKQLKPQEFSELDTRYVNSLKLNLAAIN